jgi:hypothetical protein
MKLITLKAVLILMCCLQAGAVTVPELQQIATTMAANSNQLKQYTYRQRTEVYYDQELKTSQIDEVHYDIRGEQVRIPLAQQKAERKQHVRGPMARFVAKRIEAKEQDVTDYVARLVALSSRYTAHEGTRSAIAMRSADVTISPARNMVLRMRDFAKDGDLVKLTFNDRKCLVRAEIETALDDDPVTITVLFDVLKSGVSYAMKSVVSSQAKQLEVRSYLDDFKL